MPPKTTVYKTNINHKAGTHPGKITRPTQNQTFSVEYDRAIVLTLKILNCGFFQQPLNIFGLLAKPHSESSLPQP